MRIRNHGKYTHMSKNNPRGIGRCDYSGLMVQQRAMIRQMEYRGTGLVWTGYYVNPKFADDPNPQNLTPLIRLDPVPLLNARPDNEIDVVTPQVLTLDVSGGADVALTAQQFSNLDFVFTGLLTGDITVTFPATYNEFYVLDETTGGFDLAIQIQGVAATRTVVPNGVRTLYFCDGLKIYQVYNT